MQPLALAGDAKAGPRALRPGDGVVAFDQGAQNGGRQRRCALDDRGADTFVGVEEKIAHLPGPLLFVDVDQGLEFAQVMGVA